MFFPLWHRLQAVYGDSILASWMNFVLLSKVPVTVRETKKNNSGKKNISRTWALCNRHPDLIIFANLIFLLLYSLLSLQRWEGNLGDFPAGIWLFLLKYGSCFQVLSTEMQAPASWNKDFLLAHFHMVFPWSPTTSPVSHTLKILLTHIPPDFYLTELANTLSSLVM